MALKRKHTCFWTLGLCLLFNNLSKADIPTLPSIDNPKFKQEFIDRHNEMRSQVKPPAANMNYLTWDKELAKLAKYWAKQCKFSHNPCTETRYRCIEKYETVGENIYLGGIKVTPSQVVSGWYNESAYYDFDLNKCSKTCGHFIQLVWAKTYKVGCAVVNCPHLLGRSAALYVCNYTPGGNIPGKMPYIKGEPCTQCDFNDCINNLCSKQKRKDSIRQ
ncbi:GLIPR1-like protein 1 [Meriones unguiculatus]|uniref:GLIPR1-like protein 1 n=1 Tax=Meriones unguiculatus TaxID=10047 RepID=UPI00293F79CE|nr:GLIPR1-like protein 1 [Meriones unguiculatus]